MPRTISTEQKLAALDHAMVQLLIAIRDQDSFLELQADAMEILDNYFRSTCPHENVTAGWCDDCGSMVGTETEG